MQPTNHATNCMYAFFSSKDGAWNPHFVTWKKSILWQVNVHCWAQCSGIFAMLQRIWGRIKQSYAFHVLLSTMAFLPLIDIITDYAFIIISFKFTESDSPHYNLKQIVTTLFQAGFICSLLGKKLKGEWVRVPWKTFGCVISDSFYSGSFETVYGSRDCIGWFKTIFTRTSIMPHVTECRGGGDIFGATTWTD